MRGVPGEYERASVQIDWKRKLVNSIGMVFTPFVRLRADVAYVDIKNDTSVSNFTQPNSPMQTGSDTFARAMPAIGMEWRYPFLAVQEWGTQIIEPIAQIILRPSETQIGKLPNEDSQSVVFSDTNLFAIDKFGGYDRVEGGSRVNAGVQYTANFNNYGTLNALFGQSYQIAGKNSYATPDNVNAGLEFGAAKRRFGLCRAAVLPAEREPCVHHPLSSGQEQLRYEALRGGSKNQLGSLAVEYDLRAVRSAAADRLPQPA